MADEGVANASDIDINATLDNQSYGKVSTIINAIISKIQTIVSNYVQKPSTTLNNKAYIYKNGSLVVVDASDIPFVNSPTTFDASVTNVALALEWLDDHKAPMPDNIADNKRYVMYNGAWTEIQIISTSIPFTGSSYYDGSIDTVYKALDFLGKAAVGSYSIEDITDLNVNSTISISSFDNGLLPLDGYHYNLGSISSLMFSNKMLAMKIGTTVVFTASDDFVVKLPYSYTDNGTTINPDVPARMVGMDKLECISGNQYVITITTACNTDGSPINLFNMQQLITPTATSNNIS